MKPLPPWSRGAYPWLLYPNPDERVSQLADLANFYGNSRFCRQYRSDLRETSKEGRGNEK